MAPFSHPSTFLATNCHLKVSCSLYWTLLGATNWMPKWNASRAHTTGGSTALQATRLGDVNHTTSCANGRDWSRASAAAEKPKATLSARIIRRLADGDEAAGGEEDACADMYEAAQAQLHQEMKEAGMEGSLPLSFGGSRFNAPRKRKRLEVEEEEEEEEAHEEEKEDGTIAVVEVEEQAVKEDGPKTETEIVDKVRVVYDSDGEVAERVVEKVEVTAVVQPEKNEGEHKNSSGKTSKKKKNKYPVRGWYPTGPRKLVFGAWSAVTPQVIAEHIAKRLSCDIVVDPFSGCGGNVIQLAKTCKHVVAIDIDPEKIRMAKHNAAIYGVADKIEWIVGNSIDILPKVKADAVFLSPPWGGVKYSRKHFSLEEMLVKGVTGLDLFTIASKVSKNIAYYLPRGTPDSDLEALTPDEPLTTGT
ncbi:hypothetical protein ON010_g18105 [Phytophthora cinnamomi]|nr:hypothetical protein ON010_g18105 [Phytophthora cinnamomi]